MLLFLKALHPAIALLAFWSIVAAGDVLHPVSVDTQVTIKPTDANFNISAVSTGRFVTSKDGTQIFAEARGNPSKPAVVFIHGFRLGATVFDSIFDDPHWLSQVYLVRYDTRGHGRSDKPTDATSWASERLAQDFDAVVQSYNLHCPFVLAWSLGGTHIVDILSIHPATYLSGIIYNAAIPDTTHLMSVVSPAGVALVLKILSFPQAFIEFINLCHPALEWNFYLACLGNGDVQPTIAAGFAGTRSQNSTALLNAGRSGELALLAIFGADDKLIQKQPALDFISGWKNLTVTTLPNAEHFTWISQPELFRTTVLEWIAGHRKRGI
ncbi:putative oxidoreductase ephD [Favolaschia claudopus]|uniref:Oxidoreductase ephD n=1 Tax=Favolaschia claudopus TaxID=2862362 RepID=A0AAW0D1A4_9AGAR